MGVRAALLLKHIRENEATGSSLEELCQVLPALRKTHVQSLLKTLKKRGEVHSMGRTRGGRWLPGPALEGDTSNGEEANYD